VCRIRGYIGLDMGRIRNTLFRDYRAFWLGFCSLERIKKSWRVGLSGFYEKNL